jgi:hypothetical protein
MNADDAQFFRSELSAFLCGTSLAILTEPVSEDASLLSAFS